MKSALIGIASFLVKGRKYTLALVGAQFAYLGYKYLRDKKKKSRNKT